MSKNAIVGLTIVLCVLAAGVGGFFATRTGTVQTAPAATAAPAQVEPAPIAVASPSTAGGAAEGVIPEPAPAAVTAAPETSAAASIPAPSDSQAAAPRPVKARPKPAPQAAPKTRTAPASQNTDVSGTAVAEPPVVAAPPVEQPVAQQIAPAPPAAPQFEELVVSADSVLGLQLDSTVNSETSRIEDPVDAHVTRDVKVGSVVAIPLGSRVLGVVSQLEKGGKMRSRARLGVRFHTLVLADGTRTTIQTDVIFREGEAPGQGAAGKVGAAAAGGAILGAILGGGKGAAIGGSIGAAGGAAAVMASGRNAAVLKAGTGVTVRLLQPVMVLVER